MRLLKRDVFMKLNFGSERNNTLWTPFFCFCDVSLSYTLCSTVSRRHQKNSKLLKTNTKKIQYL